ncbi:MICOS complex subunit Mic60-like isoform X2 [Choristoneura fumiferana]|uniref:MICOS complex subunit Mic60-like isoform X2 n=1 Tax=Choristoneura fumiferana TaxID=7141 RepID=UPI003D1543AB
MFRVTPLICNSRSVLYRCRTVELRVASICQTSARAQREREACPAPPPPPPPPRDLRLLWGTLALAVFTGWFTVYAKKSPEVRDWLSIHLPWFDDFIAIAYEENMSHADFAKDAADRVREYVTRDRRPRQCSSDGKPVPPDPPKEDVRCVNRDEKQAKPGDKNACTVQQPPFVIKNICELETCLRDQGQDAVNNYMTARDACRYYNELVDETLLDFNLQRLKALRPAMAERLDLVKRHVANAEKFTTNLEEMTRFLDCGMGATKEAIANTKALLNEYQLKIKSMEMEYIWQNDESLVMDERWMKVEDLIDQYTQENEQLFPTVKYNSAKPFIQDDVDLLLHHTLRYKNKLQVILNELSDGMTERVNRGIETLAEDDKDKKDRDNRDYLIQAAYKKRQYELDRMYRKRHDDLRAANDKMLKDSLKKQSDRHDENLRQKLKQKEEEAGDRIKKMVCEAVAAEKKKFKRDLEQMAVKLKIVETKLNERLKAEREARRSQELWTAGASLLAATKKGAPLIKVNKELTALEKAAGDNDKLVQTVLKSIPAAVREEGVVPESVLRERYHRMERVALKVALVEQEGATLPVFILSWLQGLMLFLKVLGGAREYSRSPALRELTARSVPDGCRDLAPGRQVIS